MKISRTQLKVLEALGEKGARLPYRAEHYNLERLGLIEILGVSLFCDEIYDTAISKKGREYLREREGK